MRYCRACVVGELRSALRASDFGINTQFPQSSPLRRVYRFDLAVYQGRALSAFTRQGEEGEVPLLRRPDGFASIHVELADVLGLLQASYQELFQRF